MAVRALGIVCDPPIRGIEDDHWPVQMKNLSALAMEHLLSVRDVRLSVEWTFLTVFDTSASQCEAALATVPLRNFDVVFVSGSIHNVTDDAAWIHVLAAWLADEVHRGFHKPIFAICFGHQLLAQCLGGQATFNPRGPTFGTIPLHSVKSPHPISQPLSEEEASLLQWIAQVGDRSPMLVQATHQQCVTALPHGAVPLLASDKDDHHVVRYAPLVYGVQYHPEYTEAYMNRIAAAFDVSQPAIERASMDLTVELLARFLELCSRSV